MDDWVRSPADGIGAASGTPGGGSRPPDAIVVVGADGRVLYNNAAAESLFLAETGALKGRLFGHPVLAGDSAEIDIPLPDRRIGTANMRVLPIEWEGQAAHLVVLHRQSGRLRSRQARPKSGELLQALVAHSPVAIVATDAAGRITLWNRAATAIFGWSDLDMLGNLLPSTSADPEESLAGIWELALRGEAIVGRELVDQRCRSRENVALEIWAARVQDAEGIAGGVVLLIADVTGRRRIEAHIRRMVGHDAVTGLPNQRQFRKQLRRTIGARGSHRQRPIIVLALGLDRFRTVSKSLGHGGAEVLLEMIARRLAGALYETDLLARTGGDEFAILLRDTHELHDAARVANRLLQQMAEPFAVDGQELYVTCSVGIAVHPHDAASAEELIGAADDAMDRARQRGPNGCQFYTPDLDSHARHQLVLENGLHRAAESGQLFLEFQPQFEVASGRIAGVEALLRWNHPKLGLVPPARFIPVAEASGLIVPIGAWVLREACRQLGAWNAAGLPPVRMAVNVSARQFHDDGFRAVVKAVLNETGIAPQRLELELTESLLVHDASAALETMRKLRSLGIRLSIDDFGTGYSSLSYLVDLPVDTLKIDQSFVKALEQKPAYAPLVTAIGQLAAGLGLEVVAEGVETAAQLEFLRGVRCDLVQGYHLSRPVSAPALAELLLRQ